MTSTKDVDTEGGGPEGVMSKVDKCGHGEGVFKLQYSGHPQTVPFLCDRYGPVTQYELGATQQF